MRLPRYAVPGNPQHIIHRGYRRRPLFNGKDDCRTYLAGLRSAVDRYQVDVHAYVLMPDHVHLLATPHCEFSIPRMMQSAGARYTKHLKRRGLCRHPLWDGRYKSTLIDPRGYLLICMRYIELNPVRAGLVGDPTAYPWSSYHHNALGRDDGLVRFHAGYLDLGNTGSDRRRRYRGQFRYGIPDSEIRRIRVATNSGWALGDEGFISSLAARANRRLRPLPRGGHRRPVLPCTAAKDPMNTGTGS